MQNSRTRSSFLPPVTRFVLFLPETRQMKNYGGDETHHHNCDLVVVAFRLVANGAAELEHT